MTQNLLPELIIVEDSPDDEFLTLRGIENSGVACNVTIRRDGPAALELVLGLAAQPALILLDYELPRMNGLEVLTQLRKYERTRAVPVVIFSGTNFGSAVTDCYLSGANSCVTKPMGPKEYVEILTWITHYWLKVNQPLQANSSLLSNHLTSTA